MGRTRLGHVLIAGLVAFASSPWLFGCSGQPPASQGGVTRTTTKADERMCLIRAMYFESNRSSRDGLMAVGTVVMNRVASPRFPNTICGVVGQPGQFAYGVLTNPLNPRELPLVERTADVILAGARYKPIGDAMWFHVANLQIPYRVEYMAVAGGNAFYRRTGRRHADIRVEPTATKGVAVPAAASVNKAALAEAPQGGIIERFFGSAQAASSHTQNCDAARAELGALSLACEDEASGR
jgi:spore germination cell wall hydrolase CwlJ-like protein